MPGDAIEAILRPFEESRNQLYIGEQVTVIEHMLQAAALAHHDDAPPALVAAALLHDYGHLIAAEAEDANHDGIDTLHDQRASAWLESLFPPAVTEPIRLHVAAKRYLVALDPMYHDTLSPASRLSLDVQGGPMSGAEMAEFERNPHALAACRLRCYVDAAKTPGADVPEVDAYRDLLRSLLRGPVT